MGSRRKLIEVALPLDAINEASAKEKSIRHGHPSTLHLWWARRPLAACRAVLFASLVDDPSARPDLFPTIEAQSAERKRLFELIERLVQWKNSNDAELLAEARAEIGKSCDGLPPPVLDPFAGGGSIPLEAQRLGLEAHSSDLNPVAVLINKALIEIPPRFAGKRPVHPDSQQTSTSGSWPGPTGLAADVRYYGNWMRDQAEIRIGHLYPKIDLPADQGGGKATVIAWLWTRTVVCPNPVCGATMPLASSWWLSKKNKQQAWIDPVVMNGRIRYEIRTGPGGPPDPPKIGRAKFRCICCEEPCPDGYVKAEGAAGRIGTQLIAIVAEGPRHRVYLPPDAAHELAAQIPPPDNPPNGSLPEEALGFRVQRYGLTEWADLFTARQLVALDTFSKLVEEARNQVFADALSAGLKDDQIPLYQDGEGAYAYAEAVSVYLGIGVSRLSDMCNSLCGWENTRTQVRHLFTRQTIPMLWDFAENNVFNGAGGDYLTSLTSISRVVTHLNSKMCSVTQLDASSIESNTPYLISTDPPYYDNIGYADLSDFFYIWLRKTLASVFPQLFSTLLTPKVQEIIAAPYRHEGSNELARDFFEFELGRAIVRLQEMQDPQFPMTLFYAFKQAETDDSGVSSTGWETMLQALLSAKLTITGTWPILSEASNRIRSQGSNALATSIVIACRPRPEDAPLTSRREFLDRLQAELPSALIRMRQGNVAPVDLAQAAIGPGMEIFSRYTKVVEADGTPMTVRDALATINHTLDEHLESADAELDADTRWALTWHAQHAFQEGSFGKAEQLSKARNTSVAGLVQAGIAASGAGRVRLLSRDELDPKWDPKTDMRPTIWEVTHYLICRLQSEGEQAAADLLRQVGGLAEPARELAYRLYHTCERKNWASDALAYNSLVSAWPELTRLANKPPAGQTDLGL